jgi:hypothetical protein
MLVVGYWVGGFVRWCFCDWVGFLFDGVTVPAPIRI